MDSENIYAKNIKNEDIVNLKLEEFMKIFITHESCFFFF
jgi:hypothetical protein